MSKIVELTAPLGFLILHELRKRESTGADLAKKIAVRKSLKQLSAGTIYPALKDLHHKKLITFKTNGREKIWRLRAKGEQELDLLYSEFSTLFKGLKYRIKSVRNI